MRYVLYSLFALLVSVESPTCYAKSTWLDMLKTIEPPHQMCSVPFDLSIARDYFVAIGNDLPGIREYNQLIHDYESKDWSSLDDGIKKFKKHFETSPLIEAVSFLNAQSKIERLTSSNDAEIKSVEKDVREVMLLYPTSELAPVVMSTLANYLLINGNYTRSLSMYEAINKNYPEHVASCVFELGAAESEFHQKEVNESESVFSAILKKCKNETVRVAAQTRLIMMRWQNAIKTNNSNEKIKTYQELAKLYAGNFMTVEKKFPQALQNLGEMEYEKHDYTRAKYYLNEYLKASENKQAAYNNVAQSKEKIYCLASANKRLADIKMQTGGKLSDLSGAYLSVAHKFPGTDFGILANIEALLLDFEGQSAPEKTRRIKVIDPMLDQIQDEDLRKKAYLEKGLALLDAKDPSAIGYLLRYNQRTNSLLEKEPYLGFIRSHIPPLLETILSKEESQDFQTLFSNETDEAITTWILGSPYAKNTSLLYAKGVVNHLEELVASGENKETEIHDKVSEKNIDLVISTISQWKNSKLFLSKNINKNIKTKVTEALLRGLFESADPKATAVKLLEKKEVYQDLIDPNISSFWLALAVKSGNDDLVSNILSSKNRSLANVDYGLTADLKDKLLMVKAQAYRKVRRFLDADAQLVKIKDATLLNDVLPIRLDVLREAKQYRKAHNVGLLAFDKASNDQKKEILHTIMKVTIDGKLWSQAPDLLARAIKLGLSGKELAPYHFMTARSYFERGNWKRSIEQYENGLSLDPKSVETPESKYRLGKSLYRVNRKAEAIKVWQELVSEKDPFWSPLASNEIKMSN